MNDEQLRKLESDLPERMKRRPRDPRGFPIPYFVGDSVAADLRFVDPSRLATAVRRRLCFCCGETLGSQLAFLGGPLSLFNRRFGDFCSHRACAIFAAQYCPHLNRSNAKRRQNDERAAVSVAPSGAIDDHPGAIGLLMAEGVALRIERASNGQGSPIFQPLRIKSIDWYFEGEVVSATVAAERWTPPPLLLAAEIDLIRAAIIGGTMIDPKGKY